MFHFADLREQLSSYLTEEQVENVSKAYLFAHKAHEGQQRTTGEPFIIHPVAVAHILANMHIDHQSIMAAILHDTIEDTATNKLEIKNQFGDKVAELVDGVSKLDQITFESNIEAQASNLRKMMLAMTNDIRVILIKLADRLHNMRTLEALPRDKQRRIALETLEIYAPISNRLGMHKFRMEFEDLGFKYLYPIRYRVLKDAVKKARGNRKRLIDEIQKNLKEKLAQEDYGQLLILGREKHLYSLYKKMRSKDLSLSEIMDIYALRVITKKIDICYRVLGIVHSLYKPIHARFKDYIAVPKSNGYQSIHTTVIGPHGVPIEIQIRTDEMNHMAEDGIAAHWVYKSQSEDIDDAVFKARQWLKGLLDIQKSTGNSEEFIENLKIDLYPDDVYVFTPTGDIWPLPAGATAVDFAYAVHTDVGDTCIAAKIDRRLVPLSTRLNSGQTVEIITAKDSHPNPSWLSFVATGKARSSIKHWLKSQQITESRELGKRLLEKSFAERGVKISDISTQKFIDVLKELKIKDIDRLYEEIGLGNQIAALIRKRLIEGMVITQISGKSLKEDTNPLAIKGTEGIVVNYAKCCRPIPGDQIIAALKAGSGMVVHRETCHNTADKEYVLEKYVFVRWDESVSGEFQTELKIDVINKRGMLATVANIISDSNANIENVHIDERDSRHNILIFLLHVKDRVHLAKVMRNLRKATLVTKVNRLGSLKNVKDV